MQSLTGSQFEIATMASAMKSQIDKLKADIALMESQKKDLEQMLVIQSRLSSVTRLHE
jgi:hypothetical protein